MPFDARRIEAMRDICTSIDACVCVRVCGGVCRTLVFCLVAVDDMCGEKKKRVYISRIRGKDIGYTQ